MRALGQARLWQSSRETGHPTQLLAECACPKPMHGSRDAPGVVLCMQDLLRRPRGVPRALINPISEPGRFFGYRWADSFVAARAQQPWVLWQWLRALHLVPRRKPLYVHPLSLVPAWTPVAGSAAAVVLKGA